MIHLWFTCNFFSFATILLRAMAMTQPIIACSKLTIETLELDEKYVQR